MPPQKDSNLQQKDSVKNCPICNSSFGVMLWKHHCRWCARVVCDDCSKQSMTLYPLHTAEVRICNDCNDEATAYSMSHKPGRQLGGQSSVQGTEEEEREKRARLARERMQKTRPPSTIASRGHAVVGDDSDDDQDNTDLKVSKQQLRAAMLNREREQQRKERLAAEASKGTNTLCQGDTSEGSVPLPQESERPDNNNNNNNNTSLTSPMSVSAVSSSSNPMLEAAMKRKQLQSGSGSDKGVQHSYEKVEALTRIRSILRQRQEDEPFGLPSMDIVKLRMFLRHLHQKYNINEHD